MNTFSTPLVLLHLISSPHSSFCFFPFNSAWILPYWFQWIKPGWVKSSSSPSLAIDFNNKKNICYFLKKHLSELFQFSLFCFLFFFFFLCFVHFLLQPQFFLFFCFYFVVLVTDWLYFLHNNNRRNGGSAVIIQLQCRFNPQSAASDNRDRFNESHSITETTRHVETEKDTKTEDAELDESPWRETAGGDHV